MTDFNPTRPPAGRLSRIGVVIDATQPNRDQVARLCDRAGIAVVWLVDRLTSLGSPWSEDIWSDAQAVASELSTATLGLTISLGQEIPADLGRRAQDIATDAGVRVELSLINAREAGRTVAGLRVSVVISDVADCDGLFSTVDDICLPAWLFDDLETTADEVRARCATAGRNPETLGVAALLPVSIGRTDTEAGARADRDPVFARLGHPRDIGIFGTLEECQDRVIALAHAGVTDLRVILPSAPDVHDVIAQLTAMTIGTTDVLVPGAFRSAAPPPPEGWGGRPDQPPTPRVSGGSRRR